jgi:hypothetical protein
MKKTLVVGINLHGETILDKDNNLETKISDNRFIVKMDAVSPGVPNISTFENYNKLIEITGNLVKSNDWLNDPMTSERLFVGSYKEQMINFVKSIKRKFIEENEENVKGIEREYTKKKKNDQSLEHLQNFVHNKDSMFIISIIDKDETITNKLFSKFTKDELEQYNINEDKLADDGFNKIIIYNLDNENMVDVFDLLGPEYTYLTLFNLIDLLNGMGAENIIFIDLSCSVFSSDNAITKRTIRTIRRRIMKTIKKATSEKLKIKKSKGTKKQNKTKTKTKQNKKGKIVQ